LSAAARPDPASEAGFALLEVLIALAVLAVTLSAIGSLFAANMQGTRRLEQHLPLISVARAVEAGLPGSAQNIDGPLTGVMNGLAWRVDYRPFRGSVRLPQSARFAPEQVTITVSGTDGSIFRLDTVRLVSRGQR
jgi:general secretion pathway protein I